MTGSPYQCKSPWRDPLSNDRWGDGGEQHRGRGSGDLHGEKCEIQATRLNWLKESKGLKGTLSAISAFALAPIPGWLFVTQHATPCRSHPFASEHSKPTTTASTPSSSGCRSSAWRKLKDALFRDNGNRGATASAKHVHRFIVIKVLVNCTKQALWPVT